MERFYGYGIVNKDGIPVRSFRESEAEVARSIAKFSNEEDFVGTPYRVVELFYKEEDVPVGPIPTLKEMRELLNGDGQK